MNNFLLTEKLILGYSYTAASLKMKSLEGKERALGCKIVTLINIKRNISANQNTSGFVFVFDPSWLRNFQ